MKATFWQHIIHGSSTHFQIVLLLICANCSGGELVRTNGRETINVAALSDHPTLVSDQSALVTAGQKLFLKNCAHCHGADARGDEGPDLHDLDWTDEQIAGRIRNGKKGQMTAFAGKLSEDNIRAVISYLRTLK